MIHQEEHEKEEQEEDQEEGRIDKNLKSSFNYTSPPTREVLRQEKWMVAKWQIGQEK